MFPSFRHISLYLTNRLIQACTWADQYQKQKKTQLLQKFLIPTIIWVLIPYKGIMNYAGIDQSVEF